MRKITNILGITVDDITMNDAINKINSFIKSQNFHTVFTPNPEFIMNTRTDSGFKEILNNGNLIIADGSGIVLASRILEGKKIQRVTGFDTVMNLFKLGSDGLISFYILAGGEGVASLAKKNLQEMYPNIKILGTHNGYFWKNNIEEQQVIDEINTLKPDVLFVGMGSPRQEKWIYKNRNNLNAKVAMGIGGCFDIIAGNLKRAPKIFQKLGIEWIYRFILEPSRYKRILKLFRFGLIVIFTRVFGENK